MKLFKTIAFSALLVFAFGFKGASKPDFIGTYGVSENDPSQIELKINADKTFTFQNFCNPKNKIKTKGKWELKNDLIILKDFDSKFTFHTKWSVEKDGMAIRSRRGLNFWRLQRLDASRVAVNHVD